MSAITLAELAAGPHATNEPSERAARQDRHNASRPRSKPSPSTAPRPALTAVCTRQLWLVVVQDLQKEAPPCPLLTLLLRFRLRGDLLQ